MRTNSNWVVPEDLKFVSDPMSVGRHILELNASNNAVIRSYVWGLDLSGSADGAGGVGGLLWVTMNSGPASGTHFACYDRNGNVVGLVSPNTGTGTARYEYGLPRGRDEPIRFTGSAARQNPFRFSTKRSDNTTDLVLYEYRVYNPSLGRWLSRDPIGEEGGIGLHVFVGNDPVYRLDPLGLRDPIYGAGRLCVHARCKPEYLEDLRYLPEDDATKLLPLSPPGQCVDADAFYAPGFCWKIPDNARLTIKCDKDGCLSNFNYRKWPWWAGSGPKWEWDFDNDKPGPKPPKLLGDIPPYPNQPPKEEPPKK